MTMNNLKESSKYVAFDSEVTAHDIEAYRAAGHKSPESSWLALIVILAFISGIFFIGLIAGVIGGLSNGYLSRSEIEEALIPAVASIVFSLLIFPLYFLNKSATNRAIARVILVRRFAESNGLTYEAEAKSLDLSGMLFKAGTEAKTYDLVRSNQGIDFMFGTHQYVTGDGRGRVDNEWSFIAVPIKTDMSHVVMDAKANNGKLFGKEFFSGLPETFDKNQEVHTSPEVDAVYRVYSTDQNGESLEKLISPGFVAKMKQLSQPYDIEVVGGKVYVYSAIPFKKTKAQFAEILGIVDTIADTFTLSATGGVRSAAQDSETKTIAAPASTLRGHTPKYIKYIGVFAVVIQFVALTALIISNNR